MGLITRRDLSYVGMIGTGGVGTGDYFRLNGDHTLGREESRSGRFIDRRDYCKLHIICHYTKALLGEEFEVLPIGRVGGDSAGSKLLDEMNNHGLDLRYVERTDELPTLYSFCFLYPDGSGGNFTTDNSASMAVDRAAVERATPTMTKLGARGIAVAAPEVPLETRLHLLRLAGENGLFRIASFTSEEIPLLINVDLAELTELIAVNEDEAAAFLDGQPTNEPERVIRSLASRYPKIWISMTAGAQGSWSWDGETVTHVPAAPVEVETTGGAGDAHLAGIIAGIVCGFSLAEAQRLGTVMAGASIGSPHTIDYELSRRKLARIAAASDHLESVGELF